MNEPDPEVDDAGGSPACFAHLLCPECAAVPEDDATVCWRCGTDLPRRRET